TSSTSSSLSESLSTSSSLSESLSTSSSLSESLSTSSSLSESLSISSSLTESMSMSDSKSESLSESTSITNSQTDSTFNEVIEDPEPPHKDLYGDVQRIVMYKFFGEWKKARWQPPYPTPVTLEPYIWQKGDEMWQVANYFRVPLDWLLTCNRISVGRRDQVKPGRAITPMYTPNNADWYIKHGY